MFFRFLRLEILALARDRQALLLPVVFLLVFALLFPLAISAEKNILQMMAAGVSWLGVLFSLMINLDRFFREDKDQGILEQWLAGGVNIIWFVQARIIAYWLCTGVPVTFASLAIAFAFSLPAEGYMWLAATLLSGSFIVIALGSCMASLTLASHRAPMLLVLLLVPLMVPVVIFGVQAVQLALAQASAWTLLFLLCGLACINLVISPILTMVALRFVLD